MVAGSSAVPQPPGLPQSVCSSGSSTMPALRKQALATSWSTAKGKGQDLREGKAEGEGKSEWSRVRVRLRLGLEGKLQSDTWDKVLLTAALPHDSGRRAGGNAGLLYRWNSLASAHTHCTACIGCSAHSLV
jgi:hypothetical protein